MADSVLAVDKQLRGAVAFIIDAVDRHMRRSGNLNLDLRLRKKRRIIAWPGDFLRLVLNKSDIR